MLKLPILPLTDFSKLCEDETVQIEIIFSTHKFSPDATVCGLNERLNPIFGSNVYINGKLTAHNPYGLPALSFPKESAPLIKFINNTKFTSNIHFHGLDTTGLIDGSSSFGIFGPSTHLGPSVNFQIPVIKNNSTLTWYHSHAMFRSVELAYAGMVGTILITDDISKPLAKLFTYGNNYLVLTSTDMDFDSNGAQIFDNLSTDANRSSFSVVNGISTIQWYTDSNVQVPYTNLLYHNTTENIVKIDILNPSGNWRVFYLGICDADKNIVPFYVIQTDQGLCAPVKTTIQFVPVAGRVSILVDLTTIKSAYLFMYDYDLTANFGINLDGTGVFPDFTQSNNTPYPTPIPDPNQENQQQNPTTLNYPILPLLPQINSLIINGHYPLINTNNAIRPFLFITNTSDDNELSLECILSIINNIIFIDGIPPVDPENYLNNLNPKYFYNLPTVPPHHTYTPMRNLVLWGETDINYMNGSSGNPYISDSTGQNVYGVTECCVGTNRIYADLWNSAELDLTHALTEYSKSPNNYKPLILPTSDFRVTQTDDQYINIAMISNDVFTIQTFENNIPYGDLISIPIFNVKVVLPPTPQRVNLNIQQWVNLLNHQLKNTYTNLNGHEICASTILSFDWSFFPYAVNMLDGTIRYFKSAIIKIANKSTYCIRILGRWPLLQMMGKSMMGSVNQTVPTPNATPCCADSTPCDEEYLYGVYDNYIQSWWPYYATTDENIQIPILCPRRNGQLIINPNSTYIGLFDGFANDNLRSFNTTLKSTEIWTYLNADVGDAHPLHFHLTSGFAYKNLSVINDTQDNPGSECVNGLTQTYSRDIYQIGPQKALSFAITWPYYPSEDTSNLPNIPNIGAAIHCHFLPHNDANSMMIFYGVRAGPDNGYVCNH